MSSLCLNFAPSIQPNMVNTADTPAPVVTISMVTSSTLVDHTPVDISRLMFMLYQDVEQQITRTDFKAQITLSSSAILAAVMANLGPGVKSWPVAEMTGWEIAALLIWIASAGCLYLAIGFALSAAFPRSIDRKAELPVNPNPFFSAHLSRLAVDDYCRRFIGQTNHEVKLRVLQQIHAKSSVLESKLQSVRRGLQMLVTALACWVLARLLLLGTSVLG